MKLQSLFIDGYKNINNCTIDFTNHTNYAAIVGLNGSGKSNIIEAISRIFASVYDNNPLEWNYKIQYELDGVSVTIENRQITVNERPVLKKNESRYLPERIIACYSGEETRMWEEVYQSFYFDFIKRIIKKQLGSSQRLIYINRYSWEIALITLLCNNDSKEFMKDLFKIEDISQVTVSFKFNEGKIKTYGKNEVVSFVNRLISESQQKNGEPLSMNFISSLDLQANNNLEHSRLIFYYLYTAFMPLKKKIITGIKVNFNNVDVRKLSEGEKKLLLIKCIMDILGDKKSFILLDEPDAHLHISRKKEIKNLIDKEGYFTVFTTHSPSLMNSLNEKNISIISNKDEAMEIIPGEKIIALEKLSDGAFTIMDATLAFATTKDIILVEGTNDYKYFTKAMEILKRTKAPKFDTLDFTIVNCGGQGNVAAVLKQIILPYLKPTQKCIAVFDNDKGGSDGMKSVTKVLDETPTTNVLSMFIPKTNGWPESNEFLTEDYFPITAYKQMYEAKVTSASTFKSLSSIQNPKGIIEDNYHTFDDADFDNFEILFDEVIRLKNAPPEFKPKRKTKKVK